MSPAPRRQCGAMQEYELLLESHPAFRRNQQRAEDFTARAITSGQAERVTRKLVTIRTVVHVVHKRDRENISDAQVKSQIKVLNDDFRAKNGDLGGVPAAWKGLVGDANIAFALAKRDP